MSTLLEGQCIDGFRIEERLHAGAMASIYRVTFEDGRPSVFPMVMKVPFMRAGDGSENITGFEVEHQMMQVLTGPHVPRFVAAGDLGATPYLVMEHIQGQTLEEWAEENLRDDDPWRWNQIAKVGAQLAEAIHSFHQQNACHLDLKPSNVIRSSSGRLILLDFGLSYHADYPDLLAEEFRMAVGSPAWMSPEQVVGTRGDPRSDIFAIGVMLYEMATGELPFGAPVTKGGLRQRLWMSVRPPKSHRSDVPDALQEIILRCLEPQADARYPSAAHLAFDLRHLDSVKLTARAHLTKSAGFWKQLRNMIKAAGREFEPSPLPKQKIQEVPLVMVCLPSIDAKDEVLWGLRLASTRALGNRPGARLAVVMVLRPSDTSNSNESNSENALYRSYLTRMHSWAQGIDLESRQVSFHVLNSNDVAEAILQYAEQNSVNLIIMGAATHGLQMQRFIATIPIRVAMDAPCTVTLVKEAAPYENLRNYPIEEVSKKSRNDWDVPF